MTIPWIVFAGGNWGERDDRGVAGANRRVTVQPSNMLGEHRAIA
jgi:hypothetical protein